MKHFSMYAQQLFIYTQKSHKADCGQVVKPTLDNITAKYVDITCPDCKAKADALLNGCSGETLRIVKMAYKIGE